MKVEFTNKTDKLFTPDFFNGLAQCAAKILCLPKESIVNVFFVNEKEIRRLNKTTRQINKVTDVLSFPLYEKKDFKKDPEGNVVLGDIVISPDYALKKTKKDLNFFFVHGLLHLCGYDHNSDSEELEMEKVADDIFNAYARL